MKRTSKNAYFKQLKNGRLKFLTKLYLHHCGKRDARKKAVREDENGFYVSPFIYQEIHLYNLALQFEEERLTCSVMPTQAKIDVFQLQIERKQQLPDRTLNIPEPLGYNHLGSEQAVGILKAKSQELLLLKNKDMEIWQLRNNQLYSMLHAKIAVYWGGVLQAYGDDPKIPPIVAIDHLIQGGSSTHEKK